MSHYMPLEIQVQIIERLPVKSLIRCRSISKAWKSMIDSSEFIARYSVRHSQLQRLLIRYHDPVPSEEKYVSFVDDETFPHQKFDQTQTLPLFVKKLYDSIIVGSCQGLLCLSGYYIEPCDSFFDFRTHMAVLWNPSIRKSVAVAVPKVLYRPFQAGLGFGVCPGTSDPKIIHICKGYDLGSMTSTPWQVKVFTLSSGAWRSQSGHLPRRINFRTSQAVIDRFLYWTAYDRRTVEGGFPNYWLIMSFDLINDEFSEVHLPDSLALSSATPLSILKLRESLAVIEFGDNIEMQGLHVWMMEHGVPKSFKKLFNIDAPNASSINNVLGFRKSGEPIVEVKNDHEIFSRPVVLPVYEPYSEHVNNIGIYGSEFSLSVVSYIETLLLLNAPDYCSYLGIDEVEDDDFLLSL